MKKYIQFIQLVLVTAIWFLPKISLATPSAPSAPTVTATSSTSISISWTAVSGATLYKLYRSTSSSGTYTQIYYAATPSYTDSGSHLSSGTTYYYKVTAGDSTGWSGYSSVSSAITYPATPSTPTVTATGSSSIDISWSSVTGATLYKLYRSTSSSGTYTQIYYSSSPSYTDSGSHLSASTTYYYKLKAGNSSGWSGYSSVSSATTSAAIPSAPSAPTVTATGATSIDISWSSVSGATLYKLYRSTSSSGTYTQIYYAATPSYTDSGSHLSSGTTYYYKVTAGNSTGWSGYSSVSSAVTYPSTPSAPTVTATGSSSIDISWSSVTGATLYKLYRSTSSSGTYTQIYYSSTPSYTDSGSHLSASTTYYYKLKAGNSSGWSDYSSVTSATTSAAIPSTPSAPTVTATGSTSMSISWSSVSGATLYKLYRSTSSGGTYTQIYYSSSPSYTDSGSHLSGGTTYYYKVTAGNSTGWSDYSSISSATTYPDAPSAPTATATGPISVDISWSSVSGATLYKLYRSTSSSGTYTQIYYAATPSYTDSGTHLSASTKYYYKVTAGNSSGWSDYSSTTSVTTLSGIPDAPSAPTVTATGPESITISWSAVTDATEYKVYRATSSSGSYTQIYWNTDYSYTDSGTHLSPSTTYYYKITAGNSYGWSDYSSVTSVTTLSGIPDAPSAPDLTATGSDSIDVDWNLVSEADSYNLYRATSSSGSYTLIYAGSTSSYSDSDLIASTTYYYKVTAGNSYGWSDYSDVSNATTSSELLSPGTETTSPVYTSNVSSTINDPDSASDTYPNVLSMEVSIDGSIGNFTVEKSGGTSFSRDGDMYLLVGSYVYTIYNDHGITEIDGDDEDGDGVISGISTDSVSFTDDFLAYPSTGYPKAFYARYEAKDEDGVYLGYTTVGPIYICYGESITDTSEDYQMSHSKTCADPDESDDTWPGVLIMSASVSDGVGTFTVSKIDGGTFGSSGNVYLMKDSYTSGEVDSASVTGGSTTAVSLTSNLTEDNSSHQYYARFENSSGYTVVGPITVTYIGRITESGGTESGGDTTGGDSDGGDTGYTGPDLKIPMDSSGGAMLLTVEAGGEVAAILGGGIDTYHTDYTGSDGIYYGYFYSLDFDDRKSGDYVLAAAAGTVTGVENEDCSIGGNVCYVVIDHGGGYSTLYLHIETGSIPVCVGDSVVQGQIIGKIGSTGYSFGTHLHFQIRYTGGDYSRDSSETNPYLAGVKLDGMLFTDYSAGSYYTSTNIASGDATGVTCATSLEKTISTTGESTSSSGSTSSGSTSSGSGGGGGGGGSSPDSSSAGETSSGDSSSGDSSAGRSDGESFPDSDEDGISDDSDLCSSTTLLGVNDSVNSDGCALSDRDSDSDGLTDYAETVGEKTAYLVPDTTEKISFGYSVATSGDWLAVGSIKDDTFGEDAGSVTLYHWDGSAWVAWDTFVGSDTEAGDQFGGESLAMDGDILVVGASESEEDDIYGSAGAVYVFRWNGTSWNEEAKLVSDDPQEGAFLGTSVSVSGNTIIAGAPNDLSDGVMTGAAYVYQYDGTSWSQTHKLVPAAALVDDRFGISVSIDGDTLAVGAYLATKDDISSGAVWIYNFDGASWNETTQLVADDAADYDLFGYSISLNEGRLLVGAYGGDNSGSYSGAAYIFEKEGAEWKQQEKLQIDDSGADDYFGHSVSLDGDTAVVGAYGDSTYSYRSGAAYVYRYDGAEWQELYKLDAGDYATSSANFNSLDIDGNVVVIGGYYTENDWTGAVHVYDLTSHTNQASSDTDGDGLSDNSDPHPTNPDNDEDGFFETDCDNTNSSIYPGATETCGDGLDQDCDGLDKECSVTYTVTSTDDANDGKCNTSHCSLREALSLSKTDTSALTVNVVFSIPSTDTGCSSGVCTISPTKALPSLTRGNTVIDGGGLIVIDGTSAGSTTKGITINDSSSNVIKNLTIQNFGSHGIYVTGTTSSNNEISGCYIGVDSSGTDQSNGGSGIYISSGSAVISSNAIAYNALKGVHLSSTSALGIIITQNSMHDNVSYGITLASSANNNKAKPVISAATVSGSTVTITGTSTAGDTIEIFNASTDSEGQTYIGETTADSSGNWTYVTNTTTTPKWSKVVATATDATNGTSQFSATKTVK